ncbi:MAG: tetratricopeptide repeat protein [Bacteroidetes bacterium]|nr:tetratricopeptide repeat protein [Bacteroidota bacterium]MBS1758034.1 tetratricopeptide repeat protein [Bacteroidota bacterium]
MKYLFFIGCLFFISCNDADNTATNKNDGLSKEQLLKNDIAHYPDSALLTENLIQYYREAGKYDKAITTVNNAIKKDSSRPRWYDIKGTLDIENEDTAGSIHSYEKAVALYPDPQYLIHLGILYAQTKNAHSLSLADSLIKNTKADAVKDAYFIKGLYYSYSNLKQQSIPYFDTCLSISYTYMDAYIEKALALYSLQKYNEALAVLDKAVTLQNNFDEGYYYRGKCLEKLNRRLEAIEAYQMALAYSPDYTEAKEALERLNEKK